MKLSALTTPTGVAGLVALDEGYLLSELIGLSPDEPSHEGIVTEILSEMLTTYSEFSTGVVLDPLYSLSLLGKKHEHSGTVLRLEQSWQPDPLAVPTLPAQWGVENVRNLYGVAKLELYYHPSEEKALEKKRFLAEVFDFCQYQKIDLLLKLVIYHPPGKTLNTVEFQEAQLEAIDELQKFTNALALQYPQDPLAAATLTSELDIPWLMVDDGVKYDAFKEQLRVSMENGATGFLVDEALWQEIGSMRREDQSPDLEAIQKFLQTVSKDRIIELMRIAEEERL